MENNDYSNIVQSLNTNTISIGDLDLRITSHQKAIMSYVVSKKQIILKTLNTDALYPYLKFIIEKQPFYILDLDEEQINDELLNIYLYHKINRNDLIVIKSYDDKLMFNLNHKGDMKENKYFMTILN